MSYRKGNWFHSRSSSSGRERDTIIRLVKSSNLSRFINVRWSGSKYDSGVKTFSKVINVNPSTMQTKIRQFIRLGYLKDDPVLPLKWSSLAEYWRKFLEGTRRLRPKAKFFEQLVMTYGLALYAFDLNDYCIDPTKAPTEAHRPLLALLKEVGSSDFISTTDMRTLIGKRNYSYWILDFERSEILHRVKGGFKLTGKFPNLINAVKTTQLPTHLTETDWIEIHNDAFSPKNPYRTAVISEVDRILEALLPEESTLAYDEKNTLSSLISSTATKEQEEIEIIRDYKVKDSYGLVKTRKKQTAWSNIVRKQYNFTCCVPGCDVNTSELTTACHIKKYNSPEAGLGHRADPRNGLCLCYLCHSLFDNGYFTLTEDLKIQMSPRVSELNSRVVSEILIKSNGKRINPMPRKYVPRIEYIKYHQRNIFKKQ